MMPIPNVRATEYIYLREAGTGTGTGAHHVNLTSRMYAIPGWYSKVDRPWTAFVFVLS